MAVQNNRIDFIDFLKAIGILLMIAAHIPFADGFVHYVHAFHMPLFFGISGFLYNPEAGGIGKLLRRIKKLLIPYFTFSFIGYFLWILETKPQNIDDAIIPIKAVLWVNSENMPIAGALWFLTALALLDILVYLIGLIKRNSVKLVIVILCSLVGIFEVQIFSFRLPWSMGAALVGLLFFTFGYAIKDLWEKDFFVKLRNIPAVVFFLILCVLAIPIMLNGILNMRTAQYGFVPVTIMDAFLSVVVLFILSFKAMEFIKQQSPRIGAISRIFTNIGKYSIIYLCMNEIVINIVRSFLTKIGMFNIALAFVLALIILKLMEIVFAKTPLRFFVGISLAKK